MHLVLRERRRTDIGQEYVIKTGRLGWTVGTPGPYYLAFGRKP